MSREYRVDKTKIKCTKTDLMNSRSYINYYERLKNIAMNMFEWQNLPDSVDVRWLEWCLFEFGYCLFFEDEVMGYLTLNCSIGGRLNVYRTPTYYRPITPSGIVFPSYNIGAAYRCYRINLQKTAVISSWCKQCNI